MSPSRPRAARPTGPVAPARTPQPGAHPGLDLVALGRHLSATGRTHRTYRRIAPAAA